MAASRGGAGGRGWGGRGAGGRGAGGPTARSDEALPSKPTVTLGIRPVGAVLPRFPTYTPTELAVLVDEAADLVRKQEFAAGATRQEAADFIFRRLYLNSVRLALEPNLPVPPGVNELLARAGKSLVLTPYDFRRYVHVAAMNHHMNSPVWLGLPFDTKLELVRLITGAKEFEAFEAAVLVAAQANSNPRVVREYVNRQLPQPVDGMGRPRGLTLPGLEKATAPVVRLEDEEQRARLVQRIASMDEERQTALMGDLEKSAELLATMLAEVRAERAKRRRQSRNRANRDRNGDD